jgi:uncharacterized DUF497 family protein
MPKTSDFEWDSAKDRINQEKHNVSFARAQLAFLDDHRIILEDLEHSLREKRYYCLEKVGARHHNSKIYLSKKQNKNHRCRVLAEGEKDI